MRRLLLPLSALLFILVFGVREWNLWPDGTTHIVVFSVGQGDSTLITTATGKRILIDGGPDWSTLQKLGAHMPFFDRSIDLLVLSHSNLDHFASFPEVLRRYDVGAIAISDIAVKSPWFQKIIETAKNTGTIIRPLRAGQTVVLDTHLSMRVLWPPSPIPTSYANELNNTSLVFRLESPKNSMLFTGDIEERVETTLVLAKTDLASQTLKVPHHGSRTSSSTGFLLAVSPKLAIISSGKNSYGHPHSGVLARYEKLGIRTKRTDTEGDIEIVWE